MQQIIEERRLVSEASLGRINKKGKEPFNLRASRFAQPLMCPLGKFIAVQLDSDAELAFLRLRAYNRPSTLNH